MGRSKNFKRGGRNNNRSNRNWSELVKENTKWENYYKSLNLFSLEQWDQFKLACQTPLPVTFRVTGSRKHANEVLELFKERHLPNLTNVTFEGEPIKPPMVLPWYPNHLAWQLDVPKIVIRKNAQFAKTQRFLVVENAVGNISRQEAVSMIPPIVLDVKPHHTVLDMCAAPGSKTAQLIEALHMDGPEPSGFVVANDSDSKRSHMLVHQLKRLNSANLMVVNHDAQFFPKIQLDSNKGRHNKEYLKFDRILCDVPCSGDGTIRKNVNIWKDWNTQNSLGLHNVQLNILNRGIQLLKSGGRLVYSTCSLSPIENEAVISATLRKWGNKIKLVDCKEMLPGLISSPGISKWEVYDRTMSIVSKGAEKSKDTWFQPTEEEANDFNLSHCIRVFPHQQNTGGFFIAVLEKIEETVEDEKSFVSSPAAVVNVTTETTTENVNGTTAVNEQDTVPETKPKKKTKLPIDAIDEPFVFIDPYHKAFASCWDYYGIDDSFNKNTCLVRSSTGEPSKVIYTVCPSLRDIIELNDQKLKLVFSGVKLFVYQRDDIDCPWRIHSEALPIMRNHMESERIITTTLKMLKYLLIEPFPTLENITNLHMDQAFVNKVEKLSTGCAFIEVSRDEEKESILLPIWIGIKSVSIMVCKEDVNEYLYRIFNDETLLTTGDKSKINESEGAHDKTRNVVV
ncbi:tRNA (cytosine-C5-)-methyltransferase NDAI_0B02980 [Naumovozyma dairenensis CBS 421]|uniref:SAM-dependent MTase RsmB/NOP-type domain-containing protein n=1 Tax=Naumovozyma dairenensis (strain ATCC 10597 / BCRC 20456 / CBS 421 / NBRC 0211 / NRRL Y-12639) TaxID=1071378 RepID=G0W6C2_NAUDC|nr:hypothetical protein NDAI_0B02980 [Naumovozyma dairenensis CBS 421]CCD23333.1 hypothetical protein NDAI_0B02980 [Naumovozyma dairenensis CBS 421]